MNNAEVLRSYLVSLGFAVDTSTQRKFEDALKHVDSAVLKNTLGITKSMLGWQTAITGAFASVGMGALKLLDNVADVEMGFQNFAVKMMMPVRQAKELQQALEAAHTTLDEAAWNPEKMAQVIDLIRHQQEHDAQLGPNFAQNLHKLFEAQTQMSKLKLDLFNFQETLIDKLGDKGFLDKLTVDLQKLEDWITVNIPHIADVVATNLIPVFQDAEKVMSATWDAVKEGSVVFDNLIGALSNDQSIEGSTANFEKFAKAIQHCANLLKDLIEEFTSSERTIAHVAEGIEDLQRGDFKGAKIEFTQAYQNETQPKTKISKISNPTSAGSSLYDATVGRLANGKPLFDLPGYLGLKDRIPPNEPKQSSPQYSEEQIVRIVEAAARKMGFDVNLADAVAQQESGFKEYDAAGNVLTSLKGAQGVMQLMPKTAKSLGVDASDAGQNIQGGIKLLSDLMTKYHGNIVEALAAYNWGSGNLDAALMRGDDFRKFPAETQGYVNNIVSRLPEITVNGVEIKINQPGANKEQIQAAVTEGIQVALNRQTQDNLAQLNGSLY